MNPSPNHGLADEELRRASYTSPRADVVALVPPAAMRILARGILDRTHLRFLASRRIQCVSWSPAGDYEAMVRADIGIIPLEAGPPAETLQGPPVWTMLSENRLTMKMCVGLPVVATPVPAYRAVVAQGRDGFLAQTKGESVVTNLSSCQ